MIEKILIANRGEIALRIIRAAREMNIATVAIYSTADKDSLHVKLADQAICVGGPLPKDSYLNMPNIIQAALSSGADAIHPGFGFLSENIEFAKAIEEVGLEFIGPRWQTIQLMGDKASARATVMESGVPVVPGSDGIVPDAKAAVEVAKEIGLPIMIKASSGGGGKGMRIVHDLDKVEENFLSCQQEAKNAFGDDRCYIERFVSEPRHIEVQVIGDKHHHYAHLFERECSMQRNNQKLIEEAGQISISEKTKAKLHDVALKLCKHIDYVNAGTIEFIMDEEENFYFIEMNTRIQVEHPVTEMITGIDLIKEQINVAANQELSFKQEDVKCNGHAIEVRINAEDAYDNFKPSCGLISGLHFPGGNGVRIDSMIYQGYNIPPYYDSMLAKIIVHAATRPQAIEKMIRCLEEIDIVGINTNIEFQLNLLLTKAFLKGHYNTATVAKYLEEVRNVSKAER